MNRIEAREISLGYKRKKIDNLIEREAAQGATSTTVVNLPLEIRNELMCRGFTITDLIVPIGCEKLARIDWY